MILAKEGVTEESLHDYGNCTKGGFGGGSGVGWGGRPNTAVLELVAVFGSQNGLS